jgi:hypothetical protein
MQLWWVKNDTSAHIGNLKMTDKRTCLRKKVSSSFSLKSHLKKKGDTAVSFLGESNDTNRTEIVNTM